MEFSRRTIAEWDADMEPPCEMGDPDMPRGHTGHHMHVEGNGYVCSCYVCSCGSIFGCFSFAADPRLGSDNPAEVAAAAREYRAYLDSISCSLCGKRGVVAEQDWGQAA